MEHVVNVTFHSLCFFSYCNSYLLPLVFHHVLFWVGLLMEDILQHLGWLNPYK